MGDRATLLSDLEWYISVLFGWIGVAFVFEHFQGVDQLDTRLAWLNNLINIAPAGGYIGIGKLLGILCNQFFSPLFRAGGFFQFLL